MMFESVETERYQNWIINIYFRTVKNNPKKKIKCAEEQFNWQTKCELFSNTKPKFLSVIEISYELVDFCAIHKLYDMKN